MGVVVRCPAKINTVLRVVGRREDGFHELDTEFLTLELHDLLWLEPAESGFSLELTGAPPGEVPVEDNLVLRAARGLRELVGVSALPGASLRLEKRVPAAAGLGGGSSDAAGALLGLCRLFSLEVPAPRLAELALALGSDVPYFLLGGRCRGRGRGELLEELEDLEEAPVVLLVANERLSTAEVFRAHARLQRASGTGESAVLTRRKTGLSLPGTPWSRGDDRRLLNDLRPAALKISPRLADVTERLEAVVGPGNAGLSGSGPTQFALLRPGEDVDGIERRRPLLEAGDASLIVTRTLGRRELVRCRFEAPPGAFPG